jgi:hypothetical protein
MAWRLAHAHGLAAKALVIGQRHRAVGHRHLHGRPSGRGASCHTVRSPMVIKKRLDATVGWLNVDTALQVNAGQVNRLDLAPQLRRGILGFSPARHSCGHMNWGPALPLRVVRCQ